MRRAIICAMPAEGHVRPLLVVAQALQARGWEVRMLTGARYAPLVQRAGVVHCPLPPEADTLDELSASDDERRRGRAVINEMVDDAFFAPAPTAGAELLRLLEEQPADVVLHDPMFLGVQALHRLPAARRPLTALCGIIPLGIVSRDTPPFGLGLHPLRQPLLNRLRNRVMTAAATRWVLRPVHRAADRTLASMGAPGLEGRFFMSMLERSDLIAQFTVPAFEFPRSDAPESLRFYGPMTRLGSSGIEAPAWFDRLDTRRPLVHLTQGTVANTDFGELVEPALTALAQRDVTVVITTGGRPLDTLPPLPPNALAGEFLPYDRLLPRTDLLITNGGYGGLHHAMEHGVPIIIAGDTEDKVETSARVGWSGVGIDLRTGRPTAEAIGAAVDRVLGDPSYAATSRRMGEAIATSRGAEGFVDDLETALGRHGTAGVP